jgi:cleavage and polyadenylation specificity factor subunit 3
MLTDNRKKALRCLVANISFAAHVDGQANLRFIRSVNPGHIILVHGEKTQMSRLKSRLEEEVKSASWNSQNQRKPRVVSPSNGQAVQLRFPQRITADVMGKIATSMLRSLDSSAAGGDQTAKVTIPADAVLITENFTSKVLSSEDLKSYSSCRSLQLQQRFFVPVPPALLETIHSSSTTSTTAAGLVDYVMPFLEDIFDEIEVIGDEAQSIRVQGLVEVAVRLEASPSPAQYQISWGANPMADMFADAVAGALQQALSMTSVLRSITCTPSSNGSSKVKRGRALAPVRGSDQQLKIESEQEKRSRAML